MLRDVMLTEARFGLETCPTPVNPFELDMRWVLTEAVSRVDMRNITAPAAQTVLKAFSEYAWQGELFPLIRALVDRAYPHLCYR